MQHDMRINILVLFNASARWRMCRPNMSWNHLQA